MICAHSKHTFRALLLVARNAARRFAPCRENTSKEGRATWRPVVLRLRRRRRDAERASVGRAALPAKVLWSPQFHSHFATHVSQRMRTERLIVLSPVSVSRPTRLLLYHYWTSVRTVAPSLPQPQRMQRSLDALSARNPVWPQAHAGPRAVPRVLSPPAVQPSVVWPVRRPPALLFARTAKNARTSAQREAQMQPVTEHVWTLQRRIQNVFLHAPSLRNDPLRHSQQSRQVPFQSDRIEELVWRRRSQTPTVRTENEDQQARYASSLRSPVRSFPGQVAALAVPSIVERAALPPVTKLDPALLDRLTDDVIRRVEQRMRIERQRRGL